MCKCKMCSDYKKVFGTITHLNQADAARYARLGAIRGVAGLDATVAGISAQLTAEEEYNEGRGFTTATAFELGKQIAQKFTFT